MTFSEEGTINSISIYHNGGTGNVLLGVYSDDSGAPATLLGATAQTAVNAAEGWQTVSLAGSVPVSSGETVWLTFVFENNTAIRYEKGTPGRAMTTETWTSGMPADFGPSGHADYNYSVYCNYTPATGENSLGNTEVYAQTSTAPNRRAIPVTFSEEGTINSISIYHNGGTGNVLLGVYSDDSGAPATLLGATAQTAVNAAEGWQTVSLAGSVPVSSGETVWLTFVFENNTAIRYEKGTPGRAMTTETWTSGMPADFGPSGHADYNYSVYCNYTPATGEISLGNTEVYAQTSTAPNRRAIPVTFSEEGTNQQYFDIP